MSKFNYSSKAELKGALLILLLLGTAYGCTAAAKGSPNPADWWKNSSNVQEPTTPTPTTPEEVVSQLRAVKQAEHGVLMTLAKATTSAKVFNYEFTPANTTHTHVVYELTSSNEYDYSNKLEIVLNENARTLTINCIDVFTQQASLKVYIEDQPEIYATLTIDYQSKINDATPTLKIEEGKAFNIDLDIDETGGSIASQKLITNINVKIKPSFDSALKDAVNAYTQEKTADLNWAFPSLSLNTYKSNIFTASSFFSNYVYEGYTTGTEYFKTDLSKMPSSIYLSLFDGNHPAITVAETLNGNVYSKDFGLKIDDIKAEKITLSVTNIVF